MLGIDFFFLSKTTYCYKKPYNLGVIFRLVNLFSQLYFFGPFIMNCTNWVYLLLQLRNPSLNTVSRWLCHLYLLSWHFFNDLIKSGNNNKLISNLDLSDRSESESWSSPSPSSPSPTATLQQHHAKGDHHSLELQAHQNTLAAVGERDDHDSDSDLSLKSESIWVFYYFHIWLNH